MQDDRRAYEMARLQSELEARAADASKGAALRQLKQIMVRIMKGEVAMRLEVWRSLMKMDTYAKHAELQAALEAQMRGQGQGAGLRMLRQILPAPHPRPCRVSAGVCWRGERGRRSRVCGGGCEGGISPSE